VKGNRDCVKMTERHRRPVAAPMDGAVSVLVGWHGRFLSLLDRHAMSGLAPVPRGLAEETGVIESVVRPVCYAARLFPVYRCCCCGTMRYRTPNARHQPARYGDARPRIDSDCSSDDARRRQNDLDCCAVAERCAQIGCRFVSRPTTERTSHAYPDRRSVGAVPGGGRSPSLPDEQRSRVAQTTARATRA